MSDANNQKTDNPGAEASAEVPAGSDHLQAQLQRLFDIGIALSSEKNLDRLLEMIVEETMRCTNADAGTLYIMEDSKLHFKILANSTLNTRMGGTSGKPITLPPVELSKENVSAYVAISGETVNIPDVYKAEEFDFTGPRKYDETTGYKSKSMLVVPMRNQNDEIIGVLQLLNAQDAKTGEAIPFSSDYVALTQSLASQAAVALTNAQLIKDMQVLFDSFIRVMATAIDERSEYTGGHIRRVAELGLMICEAINGTEAGPLGDLHFDEDAMKEMSVAGWMHDIGKVTSAVHIMDKSTKLQTIFDRVAMVEERFAHIRTAMEKEWLERKIELVVNGAPQEKIENGEAVLADKLQKLQDDLDFVIKSNTGGEFMSDDKLERIKEIGARTYKANGEERRYLSENEVENLCIRKGTLLGSERQLMQDHIVVTIKMLEQIPFPKHLSRVTDWAGGHHECVDGTGYPKGLKDEKLSTGARILAVADFFEALTATDRPYKKPMPLEKALSILQGEVDRNKLDKDIFELFVQSGIPQRYREIHPPTALEKEPGAGD